MNHIIHTHLDAGERIEVVNTANGSPILRLGDGMAVFFTGPQQLSALIQAGTDYLANRFAMAPEVEAVA